MRNLRRVNWKKRVISVALVIMMVITLLPADGLWLRAEAAGDDHTASTYSYDASGTPLRVRKVLDAFPVEQSIRENPDQWDAWLNKWYNTAKGSIDHPFTILEIVPYYDFAEFGYMIEGCEPVPLDKLHSPTFLQSFATYTDVFTIKQVQYGTKVYYFIDEPEGKREYYFAGQGSYDGWVAGSESVPEGLPILTAEVKIKGYYERVAEGGNFKISEDGTSIIPAPSDGNLVWHSTSSLLDEEEAAGKVTFYEPLETMDEAAAEKVRDILKKPGSRFYTYRIGNEDNKYVDVSNFWYTYENRDLFVTDTIGLTKEQAQTYSVQIKTITPVELNECPEWVDIADLIYINGASHQTQYVEAYGKKNFKGMPINALGKAPSKIDIKNDKSGFTGTYGDVYDGYNGERKDITWEVAAKIIGRLASAKNYIGLVFDYTIVDDFAKNEAVKYHIYDYNNKQLGLGEFTCPNSGYRENMAKLWLMTKALDPNLINQLFIKSGWIYENSDGYATFRNRDAGEAEYWSDLSFLCVEDASSLTFTVGDETKNYLTAGDSAEKANFWKDYWELYSGNLNTRGGGYQDYVRGHVYDFRGNNSLTSDFKDGSTGASPSIYPEFDEYVKTDEKTKDVWVNNNLSKYGSKSAAEEAYRAEMNSEKIPPSAALRYILDLEQEHNPYYDDDIRVLEIEPSVGLGTDSSPEWKMSKSKVFFMAPNCTGDIVIDSMTMSAFIGKADEVNGKYDLIYLGDDDEGFWKVNGKTDFYKDNSLDGLLYFHIGDLAVSAEKIQDRGNMAGTRTVDFIDEKTLTQSRFPGNDITELKVKELESYLKSNALLVAEDRLYETGYVQDGSNIKKFLTDHNAEIVRMSQSKEIAKNYALGKKDVRIVANFPVYKYVESGTENTTYMNAENGEAVFKFTVTVPEGNGVYRYKFYYDQDRNGKFTDDMDLINPEGVAIANAGDNNITIEALDKSWVGFVQWKLVVYKADAPDVRTYLEGCSAVNKQSANADKPVINALQICPDNNNMVDLVGSDFVSLYEEVDDFVINVWKITASEYEAMFQPTNKFVFNMGADISEENPKKDILEMIGKNKISNTQSATNSGTPLTDTTLDQINMFVVGFSDTYGGQDISNENGALEYLYYQAAKGDASILFTHDVTSIYNAYDASKDETMFGYSANVVLRDIMGMNRYGIAFKQAKDTSFFREGLAEDLAAYRNGRARDTSDKQELQGFTYFALLKKIAVNSGSGDSRSPYNYIARDPAKNSATGTDIYVEGNDKGNFEDNALTDVAAKLNDGQITQYPFTIRDNTLKGSADAIQVGETHAQWYQLNMEDPELTVWMTLEDPVVYGGSYTLRGTKEEKNEKGDVISKTQMNGLVYGASPQDAANNYYIYSKGNIFYSGAGHAKAGSEMEKKLFVNTMIAAYRPKVSPPTVEVTNATWNSAGQYYQMQTFQDYDVKDGSLVAGGAVNETIKVTFKIYDTSGSDYIKCKVYYEKDGSASTPLVIHKADGTEIPVTDGYCQNLVTTEEYYIEYQRSDMSPVIFEAVNKKTPDPGTAKLIMVSVPLFRLD